MAEPAVTRAATPETSASDTPLTIYREQLLERILRLGASLAAIAVVPSLIASFRSGATLIIVSEVLAVLVWLGLLLARRLAYQVRATVLVTLVLYLGILLLFQLGLGGASLIWLLAPVLLTVLLLDRQIVTSVSIVVALAIVTVTVLLARDQLPWTFDIWAWVAVVVSYIVVTAFLAGAMTYLLERAEQSLREERRLLQERTVLLDEVNHRVKNNLNTMLSLLRLQHAETDSPVVATGLSHAALRVHAMARSHDLVFRSDGHSRVPILALLTGICNEAGRLVAAPVECRREGEDVTVPADLAGPLALLVTEVAATVLVVSHPVPGADQSSDHAAAVPAATLSTSHDGEFVALSLVFTGLRYEGALPERSPVIAALSGQLRAMVESTVETNSLRCIVRLEAQ